MVLAKAGADIIGVDLRLEDLRDINKAVTEEGRNFYGYACDISNESACRALVAEIKQKNGGFDVLVNNAGVLPSGPFVERDFSVWRKTIDVNLTGLILLTHAALPILLKRKTAHIVNIASISGKFGTEGVAVYAAAKHGVVGFSSALRFELQDTAVGVSWLCPSMANTRMTRGVSYTLLTPMVQPEDVARAVHRAITTNAAEVYVPNRVRWVVSIMPALLPKFSRWLARKAKASRGWLVAEKELES